MRRRMKEDAISKSVSNNISSAQKVDIVSIIIIYT